MLQAAEKGEWDDLERMDGERRGLVEAWVGHEKMSADPQQASTVMNEMIALNQQILQLASAEKLQLMDDFKGLRQKRAGATAYNNCP